MQHPVLLDLPIFTIFVRRIEVEAFVPTPKMTSQQDNAKHCLTLSVAMQIQGA